MKDYQDSEERTLKLVVRGSPGEPGPDGYPGTDGRSGRNGEDAEYCPCPKRARAGGNAGVGAGGGAYGGPPPSGGAYQEGRAFDKGALARSLRRKLVLKA
ncbi:unnamed protein product [Nippostrongylus brasiliensis]|uniref:Collagen triple helix repeat protein n=1 Tax=Nippostrongylus brasiliensis TaxID=27835 RepID=A0A0N4YW14_NIPBR|nr:unnamed protein product [Nippostrongylus brasiliensis]